MDRIILENKIRKIISFLEDKSLAKSLEKNIAFFSEFDLKNLLSFLETSNYSTIYDLLNEKKKEYEILLEKVKFLRGKINLEKTFELEKKEDIQEIKDLKELIDF